MAPPRSNYTDRFLGLRIRNLRQRQGVTQQQLAERADLSYQQMSHHERGTRRLLVHRLMVIAQALDVDLAVLFEGYDPGRESLRLLDQNEKQQILWNLLDDLREFAPERRETIADIVKALSDGTPVTKSQ